MPGKATLKGASYTATPYTQVSMHAETYIHMYTFFAHARTHTHTDKTGAAGGGEGCVVAAPHVQTAAHVFMGAPRKHQNRI